MSPEQTVTPVSGRAFCKLEEVCGDSVATSFAFLTASSGEVSRELQVANVFHCLDELA